jgi:hypothetical protein
LREGGRWTLIPVSPEKGEATFVVDSQKGNCEVEIAFAGGAHDGARFVLKPELPLVSDSKFPLRD